MKKPELLCPAGSFANLKAAVASGADAVYLGMRKFSARAYATNFNPGYLKKAVQICKSNNVKLYLTMNTLIKNSEIDDFFSQLSLAYSNGIDAIIIKDPSLRKIIKDNYPDLRIHISTQSGVLNSQHANLFSNADRINVARELSKESLISIRKNFNKELEIFVHGALCVCISGSCLFSSFLGGRSANRGRCAQPCRKLYGNEYYLSTKELCLISQLEEIRKIGIDSLKIEGRMRTPYYTATVTSIYRDALDNESFKLTKEIQKKLESAYCREFTEGCFSGEDVFNRNLAQGRSAVKETDYEVPIKNIQINREYKKAILPKITAGDSKKQLLVRVYSMQDAIDAQEQGADIIYLDIFNPDFISAKQKVKNLYAVVPRIVYDSNLKEITERIKELKPKGILTGNLAVLNMHLNIPIHLDYNCNCFNDYTLAYYHSLNAFPIVSPELSPDELLSFKNKNFAVFAHGKIRLMTLAHQLDKKIISDKKGSFMISKIKNGSEVINSKELGLFNKIRPLIKEGISSFYIDTDKNVKETVAIYRQILDGKTPDVSKIRQQYVLGWRNGVE
jgi:collagenase-like PrtC family protease